MTRRNAKAVPFDGTPPPVKPGDLVKVRDASGRWIDAIAETEPRYDFAASIGGRCYLTVSVTVTCPALIDAYGRPVNWPAEHVAPRADDG